MHKAAIKNQQYTPKLKVGVCGNCAHRVATKTLPAWMQKQTEKQTGEWDVDVYGVESNSCGIGGFQVKKLGSCRMYEVNHALG